MVIYFNMTVPGPVSHLLQYEYIYTVEVGIFRIFRAVGFCRRSGKRPIGHFVIYYPRHGESLTNRDATDISLSRCSQHQHLRLFSSHL